MELKELKKIIQESPNTEDLNKMELTVVFPQIDEKYDLVGLYNIFAFFQEQSVHWTLKGIDNIPKSFDYSINFFKTAVFHLESLIEAYLRSNLTGFSGFIGDFPSYERNYFKPTTTIFTYNAPEVEFLLNLYNKNVELFDSAFNFITDNGVIVSSKKSLLGYILAYEFQNKENSAIFNRRESDKKSISRIRSEIATLKNNYENDVITTIKRLEKDYNQTVKVQDERIISSKKTLKNWISSQRISFTTFLDSTNNNFKDLFENTNQEFDNLQNQYGELLKLQEPVKYWRDRAELLNRKANELLKYIVGISLLFALLVYGLLWFTPEDLLKSIFSDDKTKAIRWSFVFVIFISIFFVVIRALLKFMFSNFHLARDAEEREKLTYLYISLLSKGDVSEEERKIVFQALFSRSDTGLLKEDSSPTMPGVASFMERGK